MNCRWSVRPSGNRDVRVPLWRGAHVDDRLWHCPPCGETTEHVQPPCTDGHTDGCPEWTCVRCGSAVVVGESSRVAGVLRLRHAA